MGIFGGTFNPIHFGHIHAIAYSLKEASLDQVRVLVAGNPYQKSTPQITAQKRFDWVRQAVDEFFPGDERVIVDDREVRRSGDTYTIDTVDELAAEYNDARFILIVGEDIPEQINTWKESKRLLEMVELFVVPRTIFATSSSHIRSCFAKKIPATGLLPAKIEREILKNALYNEHTQSE